jgi:hypothetical protein
LFTKIWTRVFIILKGISMADVRGESFNNGEHVTITSFVSPDGNIEVSDISVSGEYPGAFKEQWARNKHSNMLAKYVSGTGRIATREYIEGVPSVTVTEMTLSTAAYVPRGTWYSWQGDAGDPLVVDATFVPPFNADEYKLSTPELLIDEDSDALIDAITQDYSNVEYRGEK